MLSFYFRLQSSNEIPSQCACLLHDNCDLKSNDTLFIKPIMGKHDRCCVGPCNNDKRYPCNLIKRGNVEGVLTWHKFPTDFAMKTQWEQMIRKGREEFSAGTWTYVCSNHFVDGAPTEKNPLPTLFLSPSENSKMTPRKRKYLEQDEGDNNGDEGDDNGDKEEIRNDVVFPSTSKPINNVSPSFRFEDLTRDSDVRFYTGFINTEIFKTIFNHLLPKTRNMTYWDGHKKTSFLSEVDRTLSPFPPMRRGPSRKLTLEQEFFLVVVKLRVGLLQHDLAHRFQISVGKVSQIFITWIKLLSKELGVLIVWPSKGQVRRTLPDCFKKLYPNVRVIIDCTEIFTETPSSLEVQCLLWSEYKHHTTVGLYWYHTKWIYIICI